MWLPGSAQPSELAADRQAHLEEGLRDPANVARAGEPHQSREKREERRAARHQRWAARLKRVFKVRS